MVLQFKAWALASLVAIAHVEAFMPHFAVQQRGTTVASDGASTLSASFLQNWQKSMSLKPPSSNPDPGTLSSDDSDLAIPYDAAARLAYDEWRKKFGKGDFNQARFESFKSNYEAVAVANVIAAREAREASVAAGKGAAIVTDNKMELNENADMTLEEYEAAQSSGAGGKSADEMSQVLKAAGEVQDEASAALREAGAALAAEEEKLAKKLGLKSVDELEAAVDAMDGIAEDGGELDPQNLAREARIRSAYLSWCKKYGKDVDEKRFKVFEQNFLAMEEFAKENKKEMVLNQYADCTEEEYLAMTSGASPAPTPPKVEKKAPKAEASPKDDEEKASFGIPLLGATSEPVTEKKKPEPEPAPKAKPAPAPKAKAAPAPKAKDAPAPKAKAAPAPKAKVAAPAKKAPAPKSVPIATVDGEKGRKARQAAQEKEAEKLRLENEAAAIAIAREQAEREAAQIAKRRAIDEEAANVERAKAAEALAKIAKAREAEASSARRPAPKPKPKFAVPGLSNLLNGSPKKEADAASAAKAKQAAARAAAAKAEAAAKAKQQAAARAKKEAATAAKAKQEAAARARQEAAAAAKARQDAAARAKKQAAAAAKAKAEPAGFSLFKSSPAPKAAPTPAPALKLAPVSKIDTSDPVSDAFKSLFGGPKKVEQKVATPAPAPAPAKKESFTFSFGKQTPKKVVATPQPSPVPSPVAKKEPFSFFAKAPAKKRDQAPPVPAPAPKKEPFAFSFGAPKAAPKPAPVQAPAPVAKKAEPFSLFGKPSPKKVAPRPAPAPAPAPKSPAFSFGFGGKPAAAPKPPAAPAKKAVPVRRGLGTFQIPGAVQKEAAKKAAPAPVKRSPTLSLFGGGAAKPKAQVAKKEAAAPVKRSPTLSLFGSGAAKPKTAATAVKDNIPVLRNFVQNADGSLTGNVSGSKNFRNGERITTSPVRRGVKAGTVVRTGSGSQYRLQ